MHVPPPTFQSGGQRYVCAPPLSDPEFRDVPRGGSRICGRGGGAAAVPFEDPLWNFKGGGGAGGVRPLWPSLKTLFGISKGGRAPCPP